MMRRLAFVLGTVAIMALASTAGASHPRPKGATPLRVSLVPAYNQCTAANRTHGPPLAFPSCNPPGQTSSMLTVGSPDANGAPANSEGYLSMTVVTGPPGPPDDSDLLIKSRITDVRCKAGNSGGPCNSANAGGGADYSGDLQGNATIRISDHYNAVPPGGGPDPATVVDIPFPMHIPCANTPSTGTGGVCSLDSSANAVQPGMIKDNSSRVVIGISQLQVWDGGSDGVVSTTPNRLFAVQGLFIP